MEQQFFYRKVVGTRELDDIHARQLQLVQRRLELPVFVLPEDDPALVKLRQRGGETLLEGKLYGFCGQGVLPPLFDLRQHIRKNRVVVLYAIIEVDRDVLVGEVMDFFFVLLDL